MAWLTSRKVLPRSLFGRALTILLVPIVALQLLVGLVFFQRHYQRVTEQMTRNVAYELAYAVNEIDTSPDPAQTALVVTQLARPLELWLTVDPGETLVPGVKRDFIDFTGGKVAETFEASLRRPLAIDLSDPHSAVIRMQTRAGVMEASVPRDRLSVSNPHQLLVLMIVAAFLLTAVAVVFLRNQVRPIRALAEAAEAFGKGRSVPFRPSGAEEVRRAGAAFLSMRSRLERQIEQRTQMLSGVSHDLRTPLTRMKLTLALMDDTEEARDLLQDTDQMERMLGEFLAFARGDGLEETVPTDPFDLAESVADDARRTGTTVEITTSGQATEALVPLRAGAVGRALTNLVGNAARHAQRVHLAVRLTDKWLTYVVEDDGPGIPEHERARALQPFTRLDAARPQAEGGHVGLGLSIAMDVARSHGGSLELGESAELGGLRATFRVPR